MADNLLYSEPGSGKPIATDEVSGTLEHVQIIKLAISSDGSKTLIPATSTDGLSVKVTNASGASAVPIQDGGNSITIDGSVTANPTFPGTGTVTSVTAAASNTTLKASNASRRGLVIFNDSTADLYVKLGATASTTSFTYKLASYATLELPQPIYTGIVDGIWTSATGAARVTEIT